MNQDMTLLCDIGRGKNFGEVHQYQKFHPAEKSLETWGLEMILQDQQNIYHTDLTSTERDLQTALMECSSLRDDLYGSLFQQSGSVETRGQSSSVGRNHFSVY